MKFFFAILYFCIVFTSTAQNLVPNPSFEDTVACPNGHSQIYKATGWSSFRIPSADYYNSCSSSNCCQIPLTFFGYQIPSSGNAFAGIYTRGPFNDDYREFIGCHLNSSMNLNQKYFISLKINAANTNHCFTNKMGVLFSTKSYSDSEPAPIINFAHLFSSNIITDTLNWVTIKGSFISDSAYSYLIIGNFFDDVNTDLLLEGTSYFSYYYIDDVCVSTDSLTCDSANSIFETSNNYEEIILFPCPADDFVKIACRNPSCMRINYRLYNSCGKLLSERNNVLLPERISTVSLVDGVYFIFLETDHTSSVKKIVVSKH